MRTLFLILSFTLTIQAVSAQSGFLKIDYHRGEAKIFGESSLLLIDNNTYALGVLYAKGALGNDLYSDDWARTYFGLRYRHLQASTIPNNYGYQKYTYDYLEVPLGFEADIFAFFHRTIVLGGDGGIFGTYPLRVKGDEMSGGAQMWSEEYERPYFIFGFSLGFFAGINIQDNIGIRYGGGVQLPFIPIGKSPPEGTPDDLYEAEILTDNTQYITLQLKLGGWDWDNDD